MRFHHHLLETVACVPVLVVIAFGTGIAAEEVKDPRPPAGVGRDVQTDCPGPDAFGYTCTTADCPFDFIDITNSGTLIITGDDVTATATLSEPFNLYGNVYTALNMNSNGFLTTDLLDPGFDLTNDCPLPQVPSTGVGARIYALHDDLVSDCYAQYFTVCPRPGRFGSEPCTVFMWNSRHYGGSVFWLQEAILYHDTDDITVQVGAGNPELGSGSTTGLQNEDATIGLTYACNSLDSIPDNTAVCFLFPGVVPVEPTSFGMVKSLYR